jgi:hypothetical protein
MSNRIDNREIIGRSFIASIGEPWDFESDAGENRLDGRVMAISNDDEHVQWCLCKVSPFSRNGHSVNTVGIVRRYASDDRIIDTLLQNGKVGANLIYDETGSNLSEGKLRDALASGRGCAFLVGTVELA